jgi:hypothetical protein
MKNSLAGRDYQPKIDRTKLVGETTISKSVGDWPMQEDKCGCLYPVVGLGQVQK